MVAKDIKLIHQGEYLSYYEITYELPNGGTKSYEMVSKQGSRFKGGEPLTLDTIGKKINAVSMIVFSPDFSKMLLNKEFRLGVNEWVYNTTAGLIDEGENPEEAARRELKEETGLNLVSIIDKLPASYTCAPVTDENLELMIVTADGDITGSDNILEEIESIWVTREEMRSIINNSKIKFSGRLQAFAYAWAFGGF